MISVIIPVYKTEPFLDRCVQSVLDQTYRDIEIILVDDGSPDNCPAMCDAWEKRDKRIKVIHKSNGGLSDARNVGLDAAEGEYIAFVDSDDYIHPQMYELMMNTMLRTQSGLVACRLQQVHATEEIEFPVFSAVTDVAIVASRTALEQYYETYLNLIWMSACTKLYHRSIFNMLRFRKGMIFEDLDLFPYIVAEAQQITVINEALYYGAIHPFSITRSGFNDKYFDRIEMHGRHMDFFLKEGIAEQAQRSASLFIDALIRTYQSINKKDKNQKQKFWKTAGRSCRSRRAYIIKYGKLSRMRRIILNTFPLFPNLAVKIYEYINGQL